MNFDIVDSHARGSPRAFAFAGVALGGFGVDSNIDAVAARMMAVMERQLPYALSRAVNATAKDVLTEVPKLMDAVFDRPTPFAKGAFMMDRGDARDPVATVRRKPDAERRQFLEVEASGGGRKRKGYESLLNVSVAYAGVLQAALPADGAALDQYGNWSSGQRNQVLSALRSQSDAKNNTTLRSAKRNKGRAAYFVPRSGLAPGVYKRDRSGVLNIILAFTDAVPTYAPRFPFQARSAEVATAAFPRHFATEFAAAIASAR